MRAEPFFVQALRMMCRPPACLLSAAAAAYHAGLPDATRSRVLQEWRAGSLCVIAATVAFGMGVDKAGVYMLLS